MDTLRAMVASEDALVKLVECAPPNAPVTVEVTAHLGGIALRFNAEGTAFDAADIGERLYLNEHTHQDAATNIFAGPRKSRCQDCSPDISNFLHPFNPSFTFS